MRLRQRARRAPLGVLPCWPPHTNKPSTEAGQVGGVASNGNHDQIPPPLPKIGLRYLKVVVKNLRNKPFRVKQCEVPIFTKMAIEHFFNLTLACWGYWMKYEIQFVRIFILQ